MLHFSGSSINQEWIAEYPHISHYVCVSFKVQKIHFYARMSNLVPMIILKFFYTFSRVREQRQKAVAQRREEKEKETKLGMAKKFESTKDTTLKLIEDKRKETEREKQKLRYAFTSD